MGLLYPDKGDTRPPITDSNGITRRSMSYQSGPGKYGEPDGAKSTTDALYLLPALKAGLKVRLISRSSLSFASRLERITRFSRP